jgi:folate-binding protein YgfZ
MGAYDAAREACALFDLSGRGKIEAAGTEAVVFLHNLTTNDIKSLPIGKGCETFFCNATAKALAHGWVWRLEDEGKRQRLWIDLDPGLAEKLYAHLDRHLISEDVTVADRSGEFAQLHLAGPRAAEVSAQVRVGVARPIDRLGLEGVDLLCEVSEMPVLRDLLLDAGAVPGDAATFDLLRVEAGMPAYGADLDDTTFAPEVNRTAQAISYAKGCYLGQEPIVMARDRGVVQRALVRLALEDVVPPGTLLYRDGKEVGRVTSCVRSPRLGPIALGYVRRGHQVAGAALEVEAGGTRRRATVAG